MSFFDFIASIFGGKRKPPTPPPPSKPKSRPVGIVLPASCAGAHVLLDDVTPPGPHDGVLAESGGVAYIAFDVSPLPVTRLTINAEKYYPYVVEGLQIPSVDAAGYPRAFQIRVGVAPDPARPEDVILPGLDPLPLPVLTRRGRVRPEGRAWADDDGSYYPLGGSLMWALRGWKFDRARLRQNWEFLQRFHFDYHRCLGEVGWIGNDIQPDQWPDYDNILREVIDCAYDDYGLRTELTLVGGGTSTNYERLADRVAAVVRGREHKIQDLEAVNEKYINMNNDVLIAKMCRILNATGCPVAASAGDTDGAKSVDYAKLSINAPWGATIGCAHPDRGYGDFGYRTIRQGWDWRDLPFAVTFNEPIGPLSSVAECSDPLQLAANRATSIICGAGAWVLHNAAGVYGQPVPPASTHGARPANLWETPNIEAIMTAVRNVDRGLPKYANSGTKYNWAWARNPFAPDMIWADGGDHGVNRAYVSEQNGGFATCLAGIKGYVMMTARDRCRVELFDPEQGKVVNTLSCEPGARVKIEQTNADGQGYGVYVVKGTFE